MADAADVQPGEGTGRVGAPAEAEEVDPVPSRHTVMFLPITVSEAQLPHSFLK